MPLASYDYDYYEYTNGRRVNKTSYSVAPAKRHTTTTQTRRTSSSSVPQTKRSATRTTTTTRRTATTVPVKRTTNTTKKTSTKAGTAKKNVAQTTRKKKYDIDIPIKTSSKITNKPQEMTLKKPKTKKSVQALKDALIKTFGVVVFFAIAFAICYRYSLINEEFIALKNVKKEYQNMQIVNEQIEADIESKTDLTYIENYAKYQLGMQKPSDSQKRFVSIENKDKILTPITIEDDANKGWFELLCEEVRKILD
ncbi:MAG: hypothetical protein J6B87_05170 [Clostridia bacterium]|nr:hypothetical protein [Clostridia bacterium]